MHSVLWRWRGLIIAYSTGHLGVAKCLIRGGLCVKMPSARALLDHLLLSHDCWQLVLQLRCLQLSYFLTLSYFKFLMKHLSFSITDNLWKANNIMVYSVSLWCCAQTRKANIFYSVTIKRCYTLGNQKPAALGCQLQICHHLCWDYFPSPPSLCAGHGAKDNRDSSC